MLVLIEIILNPFLTVGSDGLEEVYLDFVFRRVDILLLNIILFGKTIKPKRIPGVSHISNHRKGTFPINISTGVAF